MIKQLFQILCHLGTCSHICQMRFIYTISLTSQQGVFQDQLLFLIHDLFSGFAIQILQIKIVNNLNESFKYHADTIIFHCGKLKEQKNFSICAGIYQSQFSLSRWQRIKCELKLSIHGPLYGPFLWIGFNCFRRAEPL